MGKSNLRNLKEYIKNNPNGYWFKRKIYGWGWFPVKWQGWLVLILSVVIFVLSILIGEFDDAPGAILIGFFIMTSILLFFGYLKGEKPKWSWGK